MYSIILDTCTWIYLANETYDPQLLEKLQKLVVSGKVRIIIPETVFDEWNRNKDDAVIKKIMTRYEQQIKNAETIAKHLDSEDAASFKSITQKFKKDKINIKNIALTRIGIVETMFDHPTTISVSITDEVKIRATQLALEKKAPFLNKNSMGDALIFLSAANYIKLCNISDSIFVTENKDDFYSKSTKDEIHEDLKPILTESKMIFCVNIGKALNIIEENYISKKVISKIEKINSYPKCPQCKSDMTSGAYLRSMYGGLTWHELCGNCGYKYDTGDFFD